MSGNTEPLEIEALRNKATALYGKGQFAEAASLYLSAFEQSRRAGAWTRAAGLLNNAAGADLAGHRYGQALHSFYAARDLAAKQRDQRRLAIIWLNLSSLYMTLDDFAAARQAALQGWEIARKQRSFPYRSQLQAHLASFRLLDGDVEGGVALFQQSIESAAQAGDLSMIALVEDRLGWMLLDHKQPLRAEPYLVNAFRIRKLTHDRDLRSSYISLSRLGLTEGNTQLAETLIDAADALPARDAGPAVWRSHLQRGQVFQAQGRFFEAQDALKAAFQAADNWRAGASSNTAAALAGDAGLHTLFQSYVDVSVGISEEAARLALVAVEEDRAESLRHAVLESRSSFTLKTDYASGLAKLRSAQTALLHQDTARNRELVDRSRFELVQLETEANLPRFIGRSSNSGERTPPEATLRHFRQSVREDEALLSFYLGASQAYLWGVTGEGVEFHVLGASSALVDAATRFEHAVAISAPDRDQLGEKLYRTLFGQLSEPVKRRARWVITADSALFELPFAALTSGRSAGRPVFLTEQHSTQRISSAFMLSREGSKVSRGAFVGIGDGVYNMADTRWGGAAPARSPAPQLTRLPGSATELSVCASRWHSAQPPILLTGFDANLERLHSTLNNRPSVVHFATHFLRPPHRADETVVDLGIGREGAPQVLTREDIANFRVPDALVIMSGCSSAAGGAIAGGGPLGLSRAWLMAGASTVAGSLWPTPDDRGAMFEEFYTALRSRQADSAIERNAADALRTAQVHMLHSDTWRASPSYWSAFYVLGKD